MGRDEWLDPGCRQADEGATRQNLSFACAQDVTPLRAPICPSGIFSPVGRSGKMPHAPNQILSNEGQNKLKAARG
ncbi:hypothetical protein CUJ84_Chr004043 [Rhizobium leguminosarum]|uniref:Uncharacterized protein n=1 Tax=Rhizobium leguminosarum TaxID=384 RepID=A0A2K9Z811_RHILE|nr:hypothetical protein CUJ84_Chr004043 [Rhizobium leguminosarum]